MTLLVACRVRVPCTTSNLGAGFDCLGLALDRYLDASFEPGGDALRLERSGTLAELDALDVPNAGDRLVVAFTSRLGQSHGKPNGVLCVTSEIPVAKGLGSSAAATIAGLALARAAEGSGFEPRDVAGEAIAIEGHPDNVGAALLGGLVFAGLVAPGSLNDTGERAPSQGPAKRPILRRMPLSADIGFAFAAPPAPVDTANARATLPATVPFALAARSAARLGALLHGLAHADPECLSAGFDDELHVPHRLPRIPGGAHALAAAREAGAWAATISGSGSGLIAVCPTGAEPAIAEAMCEALRRAAGHAIGFPLRPDVDGTRLVEP